MIKTVAINSQLSQPQNGVRAKLDARFAVRDGRTQMVHSACETPLKIAKTFARESDGTALEVCVMDVSPGFLSGDIYDLSWHLERGARVLATTQSFQRAHQMPHGNATQRARVSVAENALFQLAPQPLLLYRDADFSNLLEVDVARGGAFLCSEIICTGRIARGEIFAFRRYENRIEARYDGALCYYAQNIFFPSEDESWRAAAWRDFTHCGTLFALGENLDESVLEEIRAQFREYSHLVIGASTLQNGIAISALGNHAWMLQKAFSEVSKKLEETLLMK